MIFEKIFQSDDKSFLLLYRILLGGILILSSYMAYFIRNKTLELTNDYLEATFVITATFLILAFFNSKDKRYINGAAQWIRVEFLLLIQTFVIVILITVMLKTTDNYSRVWLFTNIGVSFTLFLFFKVLFDFVYLQLIRSNIIQSKGLYILIL